MSLGFDHQTCEPSPAQLATIDLAHWSVLGQNPLSRAIMIGALEPDPRGLKDRNGVPIGQRLAFEGPHSMVTAGGKVVPWNPSDYRLDFGTMELEPVREGGHG